jgi:predicted MFS family arabinose efflux permease
LSSNAIATARSEVAPLAQRWYVLIVMCAVYAVNIAARYVVTTVFEPIRLELALTDAGAAFLTGVPLALFYVVFGIPIAWLADRSNRRNIITASLVVWSAFTAFCGMAQSYWQLLLGRIGVGVGEAGATPASNAIVSDYFPPDRRPMALTVLALGAPLGAWLGAEFAGAVAHAYGWRAAFLALGVPGVLVGILVFLTIREPARGRMDAIPAPGTRSLVASVQVLWRQRAAFHVIMASGVCSLWGWGLAWWTPAFLMRSYDLDVGQAGAITGHIHLLGGIIATLGTVWLLSRPYMADPRRVLAVLAVVIGFATIPSFIAYWTHSLWLTKAMFWLFIPTIYFFIGPSMGLVQNAAPSDMRSIFTAWSVLVGNVFNLIVAPQAVGFMSDWFAAGRGTDAASLRLALLVLAPTGLWATLHYCLAAKTMIADQRRATGHAPT